LQDLEDGKGGMDFKVTGTEDGITAIQLDTKTMGLNDEIVEEALEKAYKGRLEILKVMKQAIKEPRKELSPYAPRITSFKIDPERIREVIGAGGKVINGIIALTGVTIDIDDDGTVMVCGTDKAKSDEAVKMINDIIKEFQVGEMTMGKVVRMLEFGAFVSLTPSKDGMVHVSEMAPYRVGKPSDMLNIGDEVMVKVIEVDEQGRVNLTMKGLAENEHLWKDGKGKQDRPQFPTRPARFDRGGERDGRGGGDRRGGGRPPRR